MGDFNAEPTDTALFDFCEIYSLKNVIKNKTCFKNPNKPSYIDLVITNRTRRPFPKILKLTKLSTNISLVFQLEICHRIRNLNS